MNIKDFGLNAKLYTLENDYIKVCVTNFGASLVSVEVPDRNGRMTDTVLGFDNAEGYKNTGASIGATVGRYANRIAKGKFSIGNENYVLETNNGSNHLHGGSSGFEKQLWKEESAADTKVTFSYFSKDGEAGYPGNLTVYVTYEIRDKSLTIHYEGKTDKDTILNLTNHSYFTLGDNAENVDLKINADKTAECTEELLTTGRLLPVDGTPFDFREYKKIGEDIRADNEQMKFGSGYDHSFVINGKSRERKFCAKAYSEKTGISMTVYTDMPAVQLYTANFLDGSEIGKGGKALNYRDGFCLETHFFPDTPNRPEFPSCLLKKGETFDSKTELIFGNEK